MPFCFSNGSTGLCVDEIHLEPLTLTVSKFAGPLHGPCCPKHISRIVWTCFLSITPGKVGGYKQKVSKKKGTTLCLSFIGPLAFNVH